MDIFEIKGVNAELKIGEAKYSFADPIFKDKVFLKKEMKILKSKKDEMDEDDYLLALHEMTGKMILQYLPSLPPETLDSMGDFVRSALLERLVAMAEKNFGAIVDKVEKK